MPSVVHTSTSVSHYCQSTSSPPSLEESDEVAHTLYYHSNGAQHRTASPPFCVGDLQPRDEAQKILWEDEACRRATGRHELHPRDNLWETKGWTIYNAHCRPAVERRQQNSPEPKTPVRKSKQSTLLSARANARTQRLSFTMSDPAQADTGKSLHVGVSEALVEVMKTRYSSPGSTVDPAASPCPSRTPSLTYSDGSESGEEDMPSIDLLQGSPLGGYDDCLILDCESSASPFYYGEANQCPPLIENMEAEMANLSAVFRAKQEEMDAVQKADLLFMEFINVDSYADFPMDY